MTRDFANRIESVTSIDELDREVTDCGECPRLREWCTRVAHEKRAAYRDEVYWGGPVPGFGSRQPRIWIVGLAPGAHGANRTGRMFTGDRSGDWLYASLHRTGLASQPTSTHRDDGQHLAEVRITAAVHCAPPDNKPTTAEKHTCRQWLRREAELLLPDLRAVVALVALAGHDRRLAHAGCAISATAFGHGSSFSVTDPAAIRVISSYHESAEHIAQLTEDMLDGVFIRPCLRKAKAK